jgi:hypothetical protein
MEGTLHVSTPTRESVKRTGTLFSIAGTVLFFIGIGGFGTASSGSVTMFGLTMEAKYACAIYFALGGLFVYCALEAKKRGYWR